MNLDATFWHFIADAGPVVKIVLLLLITASVTSWTVIVQRFSYLNSTKAAADNFQKTFWSGVDLAQLYENLRHKKESLSGLEHIFSSGFEAFLKMRSSDKVSHDAIMDGVQRAMKIARAREFDRLEKHLSFLATVGSTSPYIGLFGTVWGMMTALRALGNVSQATISMVAPGISESLIATAIGLFAAIPAYIAYNRFSSEADRISNDYETFQDEFYSLLHRQTHS